MVLLGLSSTFPICASWQFDHFISVNGNSAAIAFGYEANGRMMDKEGKDYNDLNGRSCR